MPLGYIVNRFLHRRGVYDSLHLGRPLNHQSNDWIDLACVWYDVEYDHRPPSHSNHHESKSPARENNQTTEIRNALKGKRDTRLDCVSY